MSYTVYKHTSPSGKVYIGITSKRPEKRWDNGRGYKHSPHLRAAIEKYGWDAFQHDILAEGLTKEAACAMEIRLIAEYNSTDRRYGYNADNGGTAPGRMSEDTRRKMADRMIGDKNPTRRYGHPFKGKRHTTESRAKMSASAKARTDRQISEQTRQRLREAQAKRAVICLDTAEIFEGIHEAAEAKGLQPTKICAVCKGKRKTTGGLRWSYYTHDERVLLSLKNKEKGQDAAIEALRLDVLKK